MLASIRVTFVYINAAFEAYSSIYNNDLPMVSKVRLRKERKGYRHKPACLHSGFTQLPDHLFLFRRTEVVNDNTYFHAFHCFTNQHVNYFFSNIIVDKNVVFQMNMMLR